MRLLILFLLLPSIAFAGSSRTFTNGVTVRLSAGDTYNITTGDISVCTWVKPTEDAEEDAIIGRRNTADSVGVGYALLQNSSDNFVVNFGGTSTGTTDGDGVWNFVCGTWAGGGTDQQTLYVNGVQEDQDTASNASLTTGAFFRVSLESSPTYGDIAYGGVFSGKVLTLTEIKELMWKPHLASYSASSHWFLWSTAAEGEKDFSGATNLTAGAGNPVTSVDGPPIMIGDSST